MVTESLDGDNLRMDMGAMLAALLSRWMRILLVTVLLLAATYAVLLFVPKMYESSAGILVETRSNAFTRPAGDVQSTSSTSAESAISSQIELIKSRDTLLKVIESERLESVAELGRGRSWSPIKALMQLLGRKSEPSGNSETVLQNLYDRLTVIRERDSAIISVYVRAQDPELAARVANAVASAHVQRRASLSVEDTAEASVWLEAEINKLRSRVSEAETAVATFRIENDLYAGTNNTSILDQQLSTIAGQITAAQERKNTAQSRADLIRGLIEAGQAIDGVPDVRASVVIQQLSQSKAALQGELAQRSSTLLPNHPSMRALAAQIAELEDQINAEGRRVADALEAEASIEANLEASLKADLARFKLSVSNATKDTVALDELEREAKAQRDLLESYLLRYRDALSRSESNPALPDVRVVTLAAPAVAPASPKTSLILGAVGFVALALQVGAVLFGELMSGRALIERRPSLARTGEPRVATFEPFDESIGRQVALGEIRGPGLSPAGEDAPAEGDTGDEEPEPDSLVEAEPRENLVADEDHIPVDFDSGRDDAWETDDADADHPDNGNRLAQPDGADESRPFDVEAVALAAHDHDPDSISPDLANLSADIALGRVRVVMVAALSSHSESVLVAESLIADALYRGLSIACIDAGSGQPSTDPGITDLSAGNASFGDVVHKTSREGVAEVPWGHLALLDRRSTKPLTLIEALTDIYEVVIVLTGRIGMASSLPVFAGLDGQLILVGEADRDDGLVDGAFADAAALGFSDARLIEAPLARAEVA